MALPEPVEQPTESDDDGADLGSEEGPQEAAGIEGLTAGADDGEEEEEEEETCGFCKYMKAGGCKEVFVSWLECVEKEKEGDGDYVEKCVPHMKDLRECMLANPDYYGPMLAEEAHMLEEKEEEGESEDPVREENAEVPRSGDVHVKTTTTTTAKNGAENKVSIKPTSSEESKPEKNV